jgi:cellulose synthase/poly-beta-1,6-N-acetylglucosamine synthase-like glycosyltransferase
MDLILLARIVFAVSVGLGLYVYLGYPLLVFIIAKIFPKHVRKAPFEPSVSFIITAFNEERDIRQKIENTFALDYPNEKLEIIVASDCSSDSTDDIVREFADRNVRLIRQAHRGGKTAAQNLAVEHATGEIIHFSDATSIYRPNALREIVTNFADETVGCVAGKLIYVNAGNTDVGAGARSYWGYETFLKENEGKACSLIGVSGCIYAVRREHYVPMYPEACSDFLIATLVRKQGLRTVYEPNAVCTEETNRQSRKEMKMRIRVISQTFTDLWRNREMLNPLRSGFYAVQLFSHKVLRYSVPIFVLAAFISSGFLALSSNFFLPDFAAQVLFFATALAAWLLERAGVKVGPLAMPLYFVAANIASVAGFLQFLRGERYAAWEPIRDSG